MTEPLAEGSDEFGPWYSDDGTSVWHGDCRTLLPIFDREWVDAVVCDPPYDLTSRKGGNRGFMGSTWDGTGVAFEPSTWAEVMRVMKPGAHLIAFGGTRTWHRMAVAIEDAGLEIRDNLAWMNGQGFPKSQDVSKAIDKQAGATREVLRERSYELRNNGGYSGGLNTTKPRSESCELTTPATDAAKQWDGWGTALEPSLEGIIVARKPLTTDSILVSIGSHIRWLEVECRQLASVAARDLTLFHHGSPVAKIDSVHEHAAILHEDDRHPTTRTGAAVGSLDQMDTSASELAAKTCLNIVTSWHNCWDEICSRLSTFITETTFDMTTTLQTLSSCLVQITPANIILESTNPPGLTSNALAVDNLFASVVCGLRATLALSVTEGVTDEMRTRHQGATGPSIAFEPIILARKPFCGTVAANVLAHGTGALNIDACRVSTDDKLGGGANIAMTRETRHDGYGRPWMDNEQARSAAAERSTQNTARAEASGRWPANVLLDQHAAAALDEQTGVTVSRSGKPRGAASGEGWGMTATGAEYNDQGGASRFFPTFESPFRYQAKAPGKERPTYVDDDGMKISHPTVKPLDIMSWLLTLVCRSGGMVLDPFAGSGATLEAARALGIRTMGIELHNPYLPLIEQRMARTPFKTQEG